MLHVLPRTSTGERLRQDVSAGSFLSLVHFRPHACACVCKHAVGEQNSREEHSLQGGEALLKGQIISRDLKIRLKKEAF